MSSGEETLVEEQVEKHHADGLDSVEVEDAAELESIILHQQEANCPDRTTDKPGTPPEVEPEPVVLGAEARPETAILRFCPGCGQEILPENRFCTSYVYIFRAHMMTSRCDGER